MTRCFLFFTLMLIGGFSPAFPQSSIINAAEMPKEIIMYANDLELLTLFRVSPEMFNEQINLGTIAPVCIKDTSVIKKIVQSISNESKKCKNKPIDVRGLLIFKYENEQELRMYYNISYMLLFESTYQIPTEFSYYLASIRCDAEKENRK